MRDRSRPSTPGRRAKAISGAEDGHGHRQGRRHTRISERRNGLVPTCRRPRSAWQRGVKHRRRVWVPAAYGRKQVASRLKWRGDRRWHGAERPVADTEAVRSASSPGQEDRIGCIPLFCRNQSFSSIRPDTVNPGPKPRHSTRVAGLMAFSSKIAFMMCGMVAEDMLPFS